jgi:hypothetical protein
MKNFLLTDYNTPIAVISKEGKASPIEFNRAIELAINEHFLETKTTVRRVEDEMEFHAQSEDEDEFISLRYFTLTEIAAY